MTNPPVTTALSLGPCPTFPKLASRYLGEYLEKIERATDGLDDDRIWFRPTQGVNSIGNLLLHLAGNLSLWIAQGLGGRTFDRDRAGEFAADGSHGRSELIERLAEVVEHCQWVLGQEAVDSLGQPIEIQGYSIDRRGAIFHAIEHMGYHTGQIVQLAKQLHGPSHGLEFYPQHRDE